MKAAKEAADKLAAALKVNDADAAAAAAIGMQAAVGAYRKLAADEIVGRIDELEQQLATVPEADKKIIKDRLQVLEGKITEFRNETPAERLKAVAAALNALINSHGLEGNGVVGALLIPVEGAIQKGRLVDPDAVAASVSRMITLLTTVQTVTPTFRPPWESKAFADSLQAMRTGLDSAISAQFPIEWFAAVATTISLRVGGDNAAAIEKTKPTRALLMRDSTAMDAANKAKAAIELMSDGYRPRIHIIDALYGDLEAGRYSKRVCDARLTMIDRCEGKPDCKLEDGYQEKLCGFDPIPAAEARIRGVAVQFSCHIGGDAIWDELARYPMRDPETLADLDLNNPAVSTVVLQGTSMSIRCPAEPFVVSGSK